MSKLFLALLLAAALASCVSVTPARLALVQHEREGAKRELAQAMTLRMGPSFGGRYDYESTLLTPDESFAVLHYRAKREGDPPYGVVVLHLTAQPQIRTFLGSNGQYKLELADMTYCTFEARRPVTARGNELEIDYHNPGAARFTRYCLSDAHPGTNAWFATEAELANLVSLLTAVFPRARYAAD
jgi:hypothetical protein